MGFNGCAQRIVSIFNLGYTLSNKAQDEETTRHQDARVVTSDSYV
jgi:hypothetical protein